VFIQVGDLFSCYSCIQSLRNFCIIKIDLKHVGQNVLKNTFTLENVIYYYF
jgi:hypothetical protein